MSKKRVLVTGGAGFLGSNLCDRLIADGCKVICLDNLYSGHKKNIAHLLDNKDFEFVEADVREPLDFDVDEIYNLACPASPPSYQNDPVFTITTSVRGAINVLDLARKCNARVLQASTSEVYGDPLVHPQPESYWGNVNPTGIRSCYDEGKRSAETLFFDYHRQYGVDTRVVRIFNTYGPRMDKDDGRVVSNFIVQALKGGDLTVYGAGEQTRSFCYVDDLIDGFIKMMAQDKCLGPINLGNPTEFTILELAEKVCSLVGHGGKVKHKGLPSDDPMRRKPLIDLAIAELEWYPQVALKEGLKFTIEYFIKEI